MTSVRLAQIVRSWELPLDRRSEKEAIASVAALPLAARADESEFQLKLEIATEEWLEQARAAPILVDAFDVALEHTSTELVSLTAQAYIQLHSQLTEQKGDAARLSNSMARRLLSRSSLIVYLLKYENFSCSQVARLLSETEKSLRISYHSVVAIARKLNVLPALSLPEAGDDLWLSDSELSLMLFPDSSIAESCSIAGDQIAIWTPECDVASLLQRLVRSVDNDQEQFWPYLQMLHWCLLPLEFYDHPVSYLYEFAPRGRVGLSLFSRYPAVTGNPVLNNAKAVQRLNYSWASNRGGDAAHALVEILDVLESLPFVPRRHAGGILRAWLIRMVDLLGVEASKIDLPVTDVIFHRVIDYVIETDTNTQGVIEQRVIDCLAVLAYGREGWRAKGLGDGVNASNFSRHKLGDVEFTNVDERRAIALEAHGGHLSVTYVQDHARSLSRIIQQRLVESWDALDDPQAWSVDVLFVAHSCAPSGLPEAEIMHGVSVEYNYLTYLEFAKLAMARSTSTERLESFNSLVVNRLNDGTVRESTKREFMRIAELPS